MRPLAVALLAALLATPLRAAPLPYTPSVAEELVIQAPVLATRVDGWIEVGTDGRVAGYEPITELGEPLRSRLRTMVDGFRFEPVLQDGRPVVARARMRLSLVAQELPDRSLRVGIENVTFPDPDGAERPADAPLLKVARRAPIHYPEGIAGAGFDVRVVVAVQANPDGSLRDVSVRQSALVHGKGREAEVQKLLARFETAALRGIARWTLSIDNPTGRPLQADELVGAVVVHFTVENRREPRPGVWAWETRTARRDAPWMDQQVAARLPGVGDVTGQDAFGGLREPRLKLQTDLSQLAL